MALLLAAFVSPFAVDAPDGLEKVAIEEGFIRRAESGQVWNGAPMPDYQAKGMGPFSGAVAGFAGTIVVFGVVLGVGRFLSRKRGNGAGQ